MITIFARSIAAKVALAFSFVVVTLVVTYVVMSQRLDSIEVAMDNVTEISSYTTSIIRINKDIIEIQRDVSVYSSSGSDAVFEKINENFQDIQTRLNALYDVDTLKHEREHINALSQLVSQLGSNLDVLSSLYKSREELIEVVLENIYQTAIHQLDDLEKSAPTVEQKLKIVEEINLWHMLHRNAWLFLSKKEYNKRKEVSSTLRKISSSHFVGQEQASTQLNELAKEYRTSFAKSVQVNRNYFNLVNVVMAGDAIEFGTLANELREHSQSRLQDIKSIASQSISTTENTMNLISIAIVLYLFLLALFFHLYMTKAITRLTSSFSRFLKGDLSATISHTNRQDEIGVLAQAASRFRDVSIDLEKEKKAAEHTSKVKSEFLANMSHEIRTPMNGILGMASQLSHTNLAESQKEMLDIIMSSGESLLVIINDVLDLSKIEADKIELEHRSVDLKNMLRDLELLFRAQADAKGIDLYIQTCPIHDNIIFIGDETRIKQILMNLLGNAIKFTDQGKVALSVDVISSLDNKLTLQFSVEDTGLGIEPDRVEKIFEAFSQADTSITRKFGGTGLGLTITSKLLALMGSVLNVESEVNKGSKFSFTIHAEKCDLEKLTDQNELDVKKQNNNNYSDLNILVAEDNKTNQIVIKGFLNTLSVGAITIAEDGDQAINLCNSNSFDLIFMDMQMPIIDGLQATKEIKKMESYLNVPIIALTANVFEDDKKQCAEAGMCDFLGKPINLDDLERILKKWVK
ncbi:ATP-binding protein [Marinomonas piezotolerans]|uniref:ATP-binding protein n=1 Tax=Marinomonas piezotolerans TaxID=2213058 RepID=UPI001314ECCE|nr:ATP-binding protein [Marinomonas piezotolerans]